MKRLLLKLALFLSLASVILYSGCRQNPSSNLKFIGTDTIDIRDLPQQPDEDRWKFVEDLKAPMWTHHAWSNVLPPGEYADLSGGVNLKIGFDDPKERLKTAYDDLRNFLAAGNVSSEKGNYTIEFADASDLKGESYRIETGTKSCKIIAGNTEGIRRGIFFIEDEMQRLRGPYLPVGRSEKHPVIQRRISRCFFGPIKRPPRMRDELMDEVDYYPDQYLNRLAHEGVNGLWLTIEFRDLCTTIFTPDAGKDAQKRLAKLKRTVESCLRYGIRTYIFCIEPRAWEADNPVIKNYPELAGATRGNQHFFCPMSKNAQKYLYESVNQIFKAVPELGGLINITHGERGTTCLSAVPSVAPYEGLINCPRCADKRPWEILYASLSTMEKGMHDASPGAELISWLYMPQPQRFGTDNSYGLADWVYELPAHTPKGVILQFNFESGISKTEFGKELVGGDYWISIPGPSKRFERIANIARENNTSVSAKIQTGNSHEVATTPYVPVPSLIFRKFAAMRQLGVSHTMLCWYFGNYPGLMNKAAGELSFEPFMEDENLFLQHLAGVYWKKENIPAVVEAWKKFGEGYENYPLTNLFQYYGPMHDGPVWPLLLKPTDAPLSPTWLLGSTVTRKPWPPSGDRIGECIGDVLTLKETVELARRMSSSWDRGVEILNGIESKYINEPERILDIGVARALGIQFHSGYNILRFYCLREELFRMEGKARIDTLEQLVKIIREELEMNQQLIDLCRKDSRLGFHSEAEGYKYYPEKIEWRMQQLQKVLDNDVPEFKRLIRRNLPLFPEYTGIKPEGAIADCVPFDTSLLADPEVKLPGNISWQSCDHGSTRGKVRWAAGYDKEALYFMMSDSTVFDSSETGSPVTSVQIKVEPWRLWPCRRFVFTPGGDQQTRTKAIRTFNYAGNWIAIVYIPWNRIGLNPVELNPIRMDIRIQRSRGGSSTWRPNNPWTSRLILGTDNPADLGWLIFIK